MRWGSLRSWQLGHSEVETGVRKSWLRRLAVRCLEWRRFGFGIAVPFRWPVRAAKLCGAERGPMVQNLVLSGFDRAGQSCERIPFGVGRGFAVAGLLVQVLAAARAKSFAVFFAEGAAGQGEKHLFTHNIFKRETALLIIADFGLILRNRPLAGVGVGGLRSEDEVEAASEGGGDGFDAASAEEFEVALVGGAQADVGDLLPVAAVFDDEVGAPGDGCLLYTSRHDEFQD